MNPHYLIDTDWVIDYLCDVTEVIGKIDAYRNRGLTISIITFAELYEGIYFSRDSTESERKLDSFLLDVSITNLNEEICKIFARERGRLRKEGMVIGDFDILIAATALSCNMTLLTNNRRHFERINDLSIESVE